MTRIILRPSRMLIAMTATLHFLAMLAPWFSALPVWCNSVLLLLLGLSFAYQLRRIGLQHADSIIALELRGDECVPLLRAKGGGAYQLAPQAYCSPLLQILHFRSVDGSMGLLSNCSRAIVVMPDACSADERRRLRRFLRWRC